VQVALAQTLEAIGKTQDAVFHMKYVAETQGRDVQRWVLNTLKRLAPVDEQEQPAELDDPPSRPMSSSQPSQQRSKPASSSRKQMVQRRMTMVDKIASGLSEPCCWLLRFTLSHYVLHSSADECVRG
jgi:hypothetical protein